MPDDAISLLQNVKQAEEHKSLAADQAHRDAEQRLHEAQRKAGNIEADVGARIASETPALKSAVEAASRRELEALEVWHNKKLEALRAAAKANLDATVETTSRWFLEEWPA